MSQSKLFELNTEINQFFASQKKDDKALNQDPLFKNKLISQAELEAEWKDKNNLSRELRVGIIGRVKAGKSSLLNALLFNGESVLPQAATPMTAALTVMKYGDEAKAEVEFYTEADIAKLEEDSRTYEQELKNIITRVLEQQNSHANPLTQFMGKRGSNNDELEKQITTDFNAANPTLVAAHQQVEAMRAHPLSLQDRQTMQTLTANSHQELMEKLNDYVGARGKYMPYTKSVTLYLKEESLKDLEVIDTPGVNDPVASREERTHEFLKQCDVVFVVSPAGQFLSHEDLSLMQRVTGSEGVQEVYLVASQVDNELCTPSEGGKGGSPAKVLETIAQKLTHQAGRALNEHDVLSKKANVRALFQKHQVVCTSSMAFKMHKVFSNKAQWNGDMQTVWNNLKNYYGDYLTPDATAQHHLEKIANISGLKAVLEEVRANKDEIRARNQANFIETKKNNFLELLDEVNDYFDKSIMKVETTTSKEAEDQLAHIRSFQAEAKAGIDVVYKRAVHDIAKENGWIYFLDETIDKATEEFFDANRTYSKTESMQVKNEARWWNLFGLFAGSHTEYYTVSAINATQVKEAINSVRNTVVKSLNKTLGELKDDWEATLVRTVFSTIKECNEDAGGERLRRSEINQTLRAIINDLPIRRITLKDDIPASIKSESGELTGYSATSFQNAASTYIRDKLTQNLKRDNEDYVMELKHTLEGNSLGKTITSTLEAQAMELDKAIKNKAEYLARYHRIQDIASQLIKKVQQEL